MHDDNNMQKIIPHSPSLVDHFQGNGFYVAQFKTPELAIFSYYVESNGKALLIDPPFDLESLIAHANTRNATIQGTVYTHYHADFIAGNQQGNTNIYMGEGASSNANGFKVTELKNGHVFKLGDLTLKTIHTPGHTPESSCFLLSDRDGKDQALFTGDTMFIGEVGRPDLATSTGVTREQLAGFLYDSLQKIKVLKPSIRIYPAHGSGSSCGKKIGDGLYCTLQKQLQKNYALKINSKEQFIKTILDGLEKPPQYYFHDASRNKTSHGNFDEQYSKSNKKLSVEEFINLSPTHVTIDIRQNIEEIKKGYIKGSYLLNQGGMLASWVGSLLVPTSKILIFSDSEEKAQLAIRRILRIGYQVSGFNGFTIDQWKAAKGQVTEPFYGTLEDLKNPQRVVLDVRNQSEWRDTGIVKNAITIPLSELEKNIEKIPKDKEIFVHCKGGLRARVGASILQRHGVHAKALPLKVESILETSEKSAYP